MAKTGKCRGCGKRTNKQFIIADDMENLKWYHKKCVDKLMMEVMINYCLKGGIPTARENINQT